MPYRSARSMSSPISTPQPSTNGTDSSSVRRPAYSPASGWTNPVRCGNSALSAGRAISSVTRPPPMGLAEQRPAVVALHEPDRGIVEQRVEQAGHEVGAEVPDVGVEPAHEVAVAHVERLPQRIALAGAAWQLGEDLVDGEDLRAFPPCDLGGGVRGAVVDHEHFVDEGDALHQRAPYGGHGVPDGRFLVAGRQAHRHRQPGARFGRGEVGREGRLGHNAGA